MIKAYVINNDSRLLFLGYAFVDFWTRGLCWYRCGKCYVKRYLSWKLD